MSPYLSNRGDASASSSGLAGLFRRGAGRKDGGGKNVRLGQGDGLLSRGVECLQASVMLCSELELHDRCGEMLEPLTCLVCPDMLGEALASSSSSSSKQKSSSKTAANRRYGLVNLVCVEDVLRNGFELASQSQDCWKYVMRCVTQVLHMEAERSGRRDDAMAAKKGAAEARKMGGVAGRDRKESDDDQLDLCFDQDDDGLADDADEQMFVNSTLIHAVTTL